MPEVLIQPTLQTLADYAAVAVEYDLGFEMIGLACPAILDGDLAGVVDAYRSLRGRNGWSPRMARSWTCI